MHVNLTNPYENTHRSLCYEYSRTTGRWTVSRTGLESANAYMASYSAGNQFYLAGGRDYRGGDGR